MRIRDGVIEREIGERRTLRRGPGRKAQAEKEVGG